MIIIWPLVFLSLVSALPNGRRSESEEPLLHPPAVQPPRLPHLRNRTPLLFQNMFTDVPRPHGRYPIQTGTGSLHGHQLIAVKVNPSLTSGPGHHWGSHFHVPGYFHHQHPHVIFLTGNNVVDLHSNRHVSGHGRIAQKYITSGNSGITVNTDPHIRVGGDSHSKTDCPDIIVVNKPPSLDLDVVVVVEKDEHVLEEAKIAAIEGEKDELLEDFVKQLVTLNQNEQATLVALEHDKEALVEVIPVLVEEVQQQEDGITAVLSREKDELLRDFVHELVELEQNKQETLEALEHDKEASVEIIPVLEELVQQEDGITAVESDEKDELLEDFVRDLVELNQNKQEAVIALEDGKESLVELIPVKDEVQLQKVSSAEADKYELIDPAVDEIIEDKVKEDLLTQDDQNVLVDEENKHEGEGIRET